MFINNIKLFCKFGHVTYFLHRFCRCRSWRNAWWSLLSSWCDCQRNLSFDLCQCILCWTMSRCRGIRWCWDTLTYMWFLNHFLHHVIMVDIRHNLDIILNSSIPLFILDKLNITTDDQFPCYNIIQLVFFGVIGIANKNTFMSLLSNFFLSSFETRAYTTQPKKN